MKSLLLALLLVSLIKPALAQTTPLTPVVKDQTNTLILATKQGNLFGVYATNETALAGFLVVVDAIAAPTSGATITSAECVPIASSGYAAINYTTLANPWFLKGITVLLSTSCGTYTPSTMLGYIHGMVR